MAYTVTGAFDTFHDNINLSGDHRATANARRERLVSILSKHFEIRESFSSGSIQKYTALKGHADLDIIVALHYGKHVQGKKPSEVLQAVRDALGEYRTNVRKNGQAVTLYYETWPNVDVVPVARHVDDNKNITHYEVPNIHTEGWIKSNPKTHAANIEAKASECGQNFRRIIKMIKHWNKGHSDYLQSYHIEVLAQEVFSGPLNDITWHIHKFFEDAITLLQKPYWYGFGFADEYLTANDRQEVLKRFNTAYDLSLTAWYHTYNGRNEHAQAIAVWQKIFGDKFPSYG